MNNNTISELVQNIKMYYSFEDSTSLPFDESYKNFGKAVVKNPDAFKTWGLFVEEIKNLFPHCRFRDFGYEHFEPSFRIQAALTEEHGLICCVSLLGPYIGYYYCDYNSKITSPYNIHPIFTSEVSKELSYLPYNPEQEVMQQKINSLLLTYYNNYQTFTPEVSAYEVDKVIIEMLPYFNVQLFHLYFSHQLNGLI